MINTRKELINALAEVREIEHDLLVQYLIAALSMKKRLDEEITPAQQSKARNWEAPILRIAREEMGHLGTVCNLMMNCIKAHPIAVASKSAAGCKRSSERRLCAYQ